MAREGPHMVSHTGLARSGGHRVFRGDGAMDVKKFRFLFENLLTKGIEPAQKAKEILVYLEGPAFDFYYEKFGRGRCNDS
jgi:hypothetical protein